VDVHRVALFYERILEAKAAAEPSGDTRLVTAVDEVLIHSMPKKVAKGIPVSAPPISRDDSALKPVFEVGSLSSALQRVAENGGVVTGRTFRFDGLTRHDILDPDGNVIQLRSPEQ
jgi:predicted enzyme related to lactoylglutathione lyase